MIAVKDDGRVAEVLSSGPDLLYVRLPNAAGGDATGNWPRPAVTLFPAAAGGVRCDRCRLPLHRGDDGLRCLKCGGLF